MLALKKILVPTDFSPQAEAAFHLACALARDYSAELVLLFVKAPPEAMMGEFGMTPPDPENEDDELKQKLFDIKPDDNAITVDYLFREGDVAAGITATAKEQQCDMIVMGTHGRSGLSRLLMGSVAEQVVRDAPCPVVTMKHPEK